MNRLVVRLLVAFLLIIGVTVVSVIGTLIFVMLLVARGIPQAAGQQIEKLIGESFKSRPQRRGKLYSAGADFRIGDRRSGAGGAAR